MRTTFFLSVLYLFIGYNISAQGSTIISEFPSLALPKIKVVPIADTQYDRQYELYIKLPEAYSDTADILHPVIYYTDAMWHVEMLSGATEYMMENAILVGISWQKDIDEELRKERAHASRYRDYSIRESSNPSHQAKYQFGQAANHLDFIRNEVIPYVESTYRTDTDQRTYFGYSLGGEFGSYILLKQPDTFRNYILGSPSIRGEIPKLTEYHADAPASLDANVLISYGTLEKEAGAEIDKLIALLKAREDKSLVLKPVVIEGSHQTAFPMTALRSIQWLSEFQKPQE